MREINRIILHMAYTPPSADIGAAEIDRWHKDRGWSGIGYHFVIRRSGELEHGRPVHVAGAHTKGENADSIGICLVGGKHRSRDDWECNFTAGQWRTLERICRDLLIEFPNAQISGHRDWAPRGCPGFDAREWASTL